VNGLCEQSYIFVTMHHDRPQDFACARCEARYKIVRINSESAATHQMLQCIVCEQPLAPADGDDLLKYFLVSLRKSVSGLLAP